MKISYVLAAVLLSTSVAAAPADDKQIEGFSQLVAVAMEAVSACPNEELDPDGFAPSMKALGITAEDLPKVARDFQTTKPAAQVLRARSGDREFCRFAVPILTGQGDSLVHLIRLK